MRYIIIVVLSIICKVQPIWAEKVVEYDIVVLNKTYAEVCIRDSYGFLHGFAVLFNSDSKIILNRSNVDMFIESLHTNSEYFDLRSFISPIKTLGNLEIWKSMDYDMKKQIDIYNIKQSWNLEEQMKKNGTTCSIELLTSEKITIEYIDVVGVFMKFQNQSKIDAEANAILNKKDEDEDEDENVGFDYDKLLKKVNYIYRPICFMAYEKSNSKFEAKNNQ